MSVSKVAKALRASRLRRNDRTWFERWISWYAGYCGAKYEQPIPVERDLVIGFLRKQKGMGKATWQRLQAARAIEF